MDFDEIARDRNFFQGRGQIRQKVGGFLLIQDINLDWCEALCAQYPEAVHPELLVQHIIRFDEITTILGDTEAVERDLTMRYPDAGIEVMASSSGNFMAVSTKIPLFYRVHDANRFHLDFTVETSSGEAHKHLHELQRGTLIRGPYCRQDILERDNLNKWRRISMHMSCFRLEANLCKTKHVGRSRQWHC